MRTRTNTTLRCHDSQSDDLVDHEYEVRGVLWTDSFDQWVLKDVEGRCWSCAQTSNDPFLPLEGYNLEDAEQALISRREALDSGAEFLAKLKAAHADRSELQEVSLLVDKLSRAAG